MSNLLIDILDLSGVELPDNWKTNNEKDDNQVRGNTVERNTVDQNLN